MFHHDRSEYHRRPDLVYCLRVDALVSWSYDSNREFVGRRLGIWSMPHSVCVVVARRSCVRFNCTFVRRIIVQVLECVPGPDGRKLYYEVLSYVALARIASAEIRRVLL